MDDPVDELFTVAPADFVARRNQLAKALRAERRRDEAKEVAALRRPTAPLWALNQLARRHPDDVADLLDAGADLPAAQDALLAGDQDRFREAVTRHRQLVSRLATVGARLVEEAGVSATDQRQDIAAELRDASTIPEAAEPFRHGRLALAPAELGEPVTGLPGGGHAVPRAEATRAQPGPAGRGTDEAAADEPGPEEAVADEPAAGTEGEQAERQQAEREEAERAQAERERAQADAEARVAEAEVAAGAARDEHRALAAAVADLEADLERARRRLQAAAERLGDAEDDLADAERQLRRLR